MQKYSAFSLIEMLITLTIAGIFTAMAVPSIGEFYDRAQDKALQSELLRAIEFSQQESHLRALTIGLCKSANQQTCGGNWSDGQIIFIDQNKDGTIIDRSQILTVIQNKSHGTLFWRAFPFYRNYLQFLPKGLLMNTNGTFWHCHPQKIRWALVLNKAGIMRIEYPDGNGVIKDSSGEALSC